MAAYSTAIMIYQSVLTAIADS